MFYALMHAHAGHAHAMQAQAVHTHTEHAYAVNIIPYMISFMYELTPT